MSLEAIKKNYFKANDFDGSPKDVLLLIFSIAEHFLENHEKEEKKSLKRLPDGYILLSTFASEHTFVASNTLTKYCNNGEFKGYCCKINGKWYVDKNWVMQYFLHNPRYKRKIEAENNLISAMLKN